MRDTYFCRFYAAIVLLWLAATAFSPVTFLVDENRTPASFSIGSDAFFTDRAPARTSLLRFYRHVELVLGKNEFADTMRFADGYLYTKEATSTVTLDKNLASLRAFAGAVDFPVYTAVVGNKADVLLQRLPFGYEPCRRPLWRTLSESGLPSVDLLPVLREVGCSGKYIFYRGDHHLTSLGAYYVYRALGDSLGYTPRTDFTIRVVKSDFSGSDARRMLTDTNDQIALFRYDDVFCVTNKDTGEVRELYDLAALDSTDPYAVFPVADAGWVEITRPGETRPRLLVICDSFGDTLAPFLARHFDLTLLDPRYFHGSVKELAKGGYTAALCYMGMDTLAVRELLYPLRF